MVSLNFFSQKAGKITGAEEQKEILPAWPHHEQKAGRTGSIQADKNITYEWQPT